MVFQVHGFRQNRAVHLQRFLAILCEVTDPDIMTGDALAGLVDEHPCEDFQQSRFACAVRADEDCALAPLSLKVQTFVDFEFRIGKLHVLQVDGADATAGRLGETECDGLASSHWRGNFLHGVDLLQLGLGLRGLAGFGAEAVGEVLELLDFALLVFVSSQMLFLPRDFFADIGLVIAGVEVEPLVRDLHDFFDERVDEFAVVRDHQNATRIGF